MTTALEQFWKTVSLKCRAKLVRNTDLDLYVAEQSWDALTTREVEELHDTSMRMGLPVDEFPTT